MNDEDKEQKFQYLSSHCLVCCEPIMSSITRNELGEEVVSSHFASRLREKHLSLHRSLAQEVRY